MASNAITSYGFTLSFDGNTIGEIMSISGSGRTINIHEIASVDSPDRCIEKIGGLINEGNVTIHIIYDGGDSGIYNTLNTLFLAATKGTLICTHSDTSNLSSDGLMQMLGEPSFGSAGEPVELDVSFERSGKVTYTDVAA